MKLLKVSFVAATMVLISATLGTLMAVTAMFLGNTLTFSMFAGWMSGLAFLFICAANWRSIAMHMGLQLASSSDEVGR